MMFSIEGGGAMGKYHFFSHAIAKPLKYFTSSAETGLIYLVTW